MTADLLAPVHLLDAWRARFEDLTVELAGRHDLAITLAPSTAALAVRVAPGAAAVAEVALGVPLPTRPLAWEPTLRGQSLHLGPDEWLVTDVAATSAAAWEAVTRPALAAVGAAASDVSAQYADLRLQGRAARELLSFGCALDLRPASFGPRTCARTLLGQSGVLLVGHDDGEFQLLVRTSFAGYVAAWLLDAAEEYR
ncbi:sarcosine oxidase subunit gamma [Actinomycetospora termitidis]|uniref:Sarcosine oxidase subunit gamma family protein n=1 Tax=Actinomycetospora termitidis TaxID=3053470 RepID=A0ABT7MEQ3_9PSEU|nr:sarcosine oxidase subunit gamma family protein [Actinomycetospora sp. Odt1-22]MDL5159150.1 sarcosine oxidase subunit gamma family protein [Actinomycetospora sp. Odt1-22]